MNNIKRKLKMIVAGATVIDVKISGDEHLVNKLADNLIDTYDLKKELTKVIINNIEVTMETVFRGKDGKMIGKDKVLKIKDN